MGGEAEWDHNNECRQGEANGRRGNSQSDSSKDEHENEKANEFWGMTKAKRAFVSGRVKTVNAKGPETVTLHSNIANTDNGGLRCIICELVVSSPS